MIAGMPASARSNFAEISVAACATGVACASVLPDRQAFGVLIIAAAGMLLGAWLVDRSISARRVWWIGFILALIGVLGEPLFEDDFYRYLWDAYRTAQVGTPYGPPPEAFFGDARVPPEFQSVLDRVNNPEVPTIYGPALQSLFYVGYLIDAGNERVLRVFWSLANLALIALLLRTAPPHRVALYAWNPLVFKEIYLSGHPDALLPALLMAGWLAGQRTRGLAFAASLGVAIATKAVAAVCAPLLIGLRRPFLAALVVAGAAALCYLPFIGPSASITDLDGLRVFANRWEFNPSPLHSALAAIIGPMPAKISLGTLLAVTAVILAWRRHPQATTQPSWHWMFGATLLVSPVVNPWYLLWLLPAFVATRAVWPWVASWALLLSYARGETLDIPGLAAFEVHPLARWLMWGVIGFTIIVELIAHREGKKLRA